MVETRKDVDDCGLGVTDRSALLRDHLATDQTVQSNERTLLAYMRTALTMFVAGVSFIQFFGSYIYTIIGTAFIPLSS